VWSRAFGGRPPSWPEYAIAAAVNGGTVVTGTYDGSIDLGGGWYQTVVPDGSVDTGGFIVMLDAEGRHVWSHPTCTTIVSQSGVATDASGATTWVGSSRGGDLKLGALEFQAGPMDFAFVARFSPCP
jgi:hypothetical protein